MSQEINNVEKPESDVSSSGLLLSVEPILEGTSVSMAPLNVDDDAPADTDADDAGSDTDTTNDDTDAGDQDGTDS